MNKGNPFGISLDDTVQAIMKSRQIPTLLMQAKPRQVVTANQNAYELFSKDLSEIEGYRGGQVFDRSLLNNSYAF